MGMLEGKSIVITGAGSGRATCLLAVQEGARVGGRIARQCRRRRL